MPTRVTAPVTDDTPATTEVLQRVSDALMQVARGDPLVSLRNELRTQFEGVNKRFESIDRATELVHDDYVRVPTQVDKAIGSLRDFLEARINTVKSVIETRLDGMDKAIDLLQRTSDRNPDFVLDQVAQLRKLHDEKFESVTTQLTEADRRVATQLQEADKRVYQKFDAIDTQFNERDKRTEQLSLADKTAIAAALQAQKEAAGATNDSNSVALLKMETNFAKLIEQTQNLLQSVAKNTDDKINDLKSRLDRGEASIEGVTRGSYNVRKEHSMSMGQTIGILSAVFLGISVLIAAAALVISMPHDSGRAVRIHMADTI